MVLEAVLNLQYSSYQLATCWNLNDPVLNVLTYETQQNFSVQWTMC